MYRYPRAFYSSNNKLLGEKYRDVVQNFGEADHVAPDISVTNGKCAII